jgi:hypothetical protein
MMMKNIKDAHLPMKNSKIKIVEMVNFAIRILNKKCHKRTQSQLLKSAETQLQFDFS